MKINMPLKVEKIINKLEQCGYEAYAVGGCIRDSLLGRTPSDWDITTSALPDEVMQCFERTYATGIEHGTITVLLEDEAYEITTFRTEEGYTDFRRPDKVNFVRSLREDLKRRDFTINAMAYNKNAGLVDLFNGMEDMNNGIIRAVGDPIERFSEDALRILRAVRFAARLGFTMEKETSNGIAKCAPLISKISRERIREELSGILMSPNPDYVLKLEESGVLKFILPELSKCFETPQNNPYHIFNVGMHIMETLKSSPPDLFIRWAMLLHDTGKAYTRTTDSKNIDHFYGHDKVSLRIAERIMNEYKFDNERRKKVMLLVQMHDSKIQPQENAVRRILNKIGEENLRLLLKVKRADNMGKNLKKSFKDITELEKVEEVLDSVIQKNQCTSLRTLEIDGSSLMSLGIPKGPVIGRILNELLEKVIEKPELNNRTDLTKEAKIIFEGIKTDYNT